MIQKTFDNLVNHTIVCGYGRNGKQTVKELISHNHTVLLIENNNPDINELEGIPNVFCLVGDATRDDILQTAGVSNAKALITTLPKDADNLFVVLSARLMNEQMPIISRASGVRLQKKLYEAGASEVVMPDKLGGDRMAQLVMEPDVVEFIDYILLQDEEQTNLEEISVSQLDRNLAKKTIRELNIRNISGANIIGLKTHDQAYVLNPDANFKLEKASHIFVLGTPSQIDKLKNL